MIFASELLKANHGKALAPPRRRSIRQVVTFNVAITIIIKAIKDTERFFSNGTITVPFIWCRANFTEDLLPSLKEYHTIRYTNYVICKRIIHVDKGNFSTPLYS